MTFFGAAFAWGMNDGKRLEINFAKCEENILGVRRGFTRLEVGGQECLMFAPDKGIVSQAKRVVLVQSLPTGVQGN